MVDMTRSERRWCFTLAAVLILVTTLPYLVGFWTQTPELKFTGFVLGVEDGNSYIAKMLSGASGEWLFRSPYSAEPQRGVVAFLPYLLLGKLAAGDGIHDQLLGLFHLARWGGILALVFSLYSFVSIFIESGWWRKWVVSLSLVGSGLGWLVLLFGRSDWLGSMPLGVYSPETFGFLSIMTFPHLTWSRALLFLGLAAYLRSSKNPMEAWISGFSFSILALFQPLSILTGYAVIAGHQIYLVWDRWRTERSIEWGPWMTNGLKVLLISAPWVVYFAFAFSGDPYLEAWTAQNVILSPHPLHYLLAYGSIAAFSVWGVSRVIKRRQSLAGLLAAWVVLVPLLAYFPHNLQRRFPEGSWVALLTTAALVLSEYKPTGRKWGVALFMLALPTSLLVWVGAFNAARSVAPPSFIAAYEVAGFEWFRDNAPENSIVLTPYHLGNALPAWAPVHVVIGHGPESVGLERLQPLVEALFHGSFGPTISDLIDRSGVEYIWFGPGVEVGEEARYELGLFLEYNQDGIQIFSLSEEGSDD
jgi:hypothetical protein